MRAIEDVQATLADRVMDGATSDELVASLETALACRLRVLTGDEPEDAQTIGRPIAPGTEVLGTLQSDLPLTLETPELAEVFEYGARLIGTELIRERAVRQARWKLESDLLRELIEIDGDIPARLQQRARHLGLDMSDGWRVLLVDVGARAVSGLLAAARRPATADERSISCVLGGRLVVAVCPKPGDAGHAKLTSLRGAARDMGAALRAGVSSLVPSIACGFRQSEAALRVTMCSPKAGVMEYDSLGTLRVLLSAPNEVELISLVETRIGPLAEHDRERPMELVETLRGYLLEGGNRRRAAERCDVHQSTIKYRLLRIGELLGCDPDDADVRFDLMLALKLLELLRCVDADPTTGRALQAA